MASTVSVLRIRPVLLVMALAAGCVHTPEPPPTPPMDSSGVTPPGVATSEGFMAKGVPAGWVAHRGAWSAKAGEPGHEDVLEGRGEAEPGLSSLVNEAAGVYENFTMDLDFVMRSGEHPQGAGAVFDWIDEENYVIIRYSISEQGWHLFTVVDGARDKKDDATLPTTASAAFNQWVRLRVVQRGGNVEAFHGTDRVIQYRLDAQDSREGFVGVFTRGDTVAEFDDFAIAPGA